MFTVAVLLGYGISAANANNVAPYSLRGFLDLGIGAVHPSTLISGLSLASIGGSTVIASVLIANIPQPILSFLYLLFNGVFTSMLLADRYGSQTQSWARGPPTFCSYHIDTPSPCSSYPASSTGPSVNPSSLHKLQLFPKLATWWTPPPYQPVATHPAQSL